MMSFQSITTLVGAVVGVSAFYVLSFFFKRKPQWILFVGAGLIFVMSTFLSKEYLYPYYREKQIGSIELMQVIKSYYPSDYSEYIDQIKRGIKKGQDPNLEVQYTADLVNKVFLKSLRAAPNSRINDYLIAQVSLYKFIYDKSPEIVVKMERNDPSYTKNFDEFDSKEKAGLNSLLSRVLATKENLIIASFKEPASPPNKLDGDVALSNVIKKIIAKYGEPAFNAAFGRTDEKVPVANEASVIIGFYSEVLEKGDPDTGVIMRYFGVLTSE